MRSSCLLFLLACSLLLPFFTPSQSSCGFISEFDTLCDGKAGLMLDLPYFPRPHYSRISADFLANDQHPLEGLHEVQLDF